MIISHSKLHRCCHLGHDTQVNATVLSIWDITEPSWTISNLKVTLQIAGEISAQYIIMYIAYICGFVIRYLKPFEHGRCFSYAAT